MKILLIGPMPYPITGVSVANEAVVKALKQRNVEFSVIDTHIEKGVTSKQGERFSVRKTLAFLTVYRKLAAVRQADVIYTTPGQTFFGILKYAPFFYLCLRHRKPYVIHLHGNYLGKEYARLSGIKKRIFRFFIENASAGIVLSDSLKKNFEGLLKPEQIHVVENFVADELIEGDYAGRQYDKLRILYMSNMMREKGILDLLDALKLMHKKGLDFHAEFAGAFEESIRKKIEKRFSQLGDKVKYLGLVEGEAKKDAFSRSNVFILPTWYIMEGQPISIIEAMATGNLVITTRHAGIPDIVTDNEAFFVHKNEPEDLAGTLINISERLNDLREMAMHNRELALQRFREERFGEEVFTLLKSLGGKN